jgi:mRNA interferase RelE/StbE
LSILRVTVQVTATAKKALADLPRPARKGLLEKTRELRNCDDPRAAGKPLTGPLQGYYRIRYSRYRAIYAVQEKPLTRGEVLIHVTILMVAAGVRKAGDQSDVYRLAARLASLGLLETPAPPVPPKPIRKPPGKRYRHRR